MPVVALPLLSLFIDIKSAASDVRFEGRAAINIVQIAIPDFTECGAQSSGLYAVAKAKSAPRSRIS
jgi:hypothetical protein